MEGFYRKFTKSENKTAEIWNNEGWRKMTVDGKF